MAVEHHIATSAVAPLALDPLLLGPRNAERFLQMLTDKEPVFEANLKRIKPANGETQTEVEKYFRGKYKRLKAFL